MNINFVNRIAALLGFAGLCIAGTGRAQASLVNCSFAGTVDVGGAPAVFAPSIVDGSSVTGTFQYDTTTPADAGGDPSASSFTGAITGFTFNVADGGLIASFTRAPGGGSNIQMYNDLGSPNFDHISLVPFFPELTGDQPSGYFVQFAVLRFDDTSQSVFGTAASLPGSLDFSQFTGGGFFLFLEDTHSEATATISMTITSLTTDSITEPVVPEPATLSLMGLGLAGVGALRRRRAAVSA